MPIVEFITFLILVVAFAFLAYPLVNTPALLMNVSIMIILAIKFKADLKENKMHIYYIISAALTALVYIASGAGFLTSFWEFLLSLHILYFTQAAILIILFAHLAAILHTLMISAKKDAKKKRSV